MKDWHYSAMVEGEAMVEHVIGMALRMPAEKALAAYPEYLKMVRESMPQKTLPKHVREHVQIILSYAWQHRVHRRMLYVQPWQGHMYSTWDAMPEALRAVIRAGNDHTLPCRVPVYVWAFREGVPIEEVNSAHGVPQELRRYL